MNELMASIYGAVTRETDSAKRLHGVIYHSLHEGYGVLSEEIFEAMAEVRPMAVKLEHMLGALHANSAPQTAYWAREIYKLAVNGACELVQVAAVAQKIIDTAEVEA